jgi:hypothetical protein
MAGDLGVLPMPPPLAARQGFPLSRCKVTRRISFKTGFHDRLHDDQTLYSEECVALLMVERGGTAAWTNAVIRMAGIACPTKSKFAVKSNRGALFARRLDRNANLLRFS